MSLSPAAPGAALPPPRLIEGPAAVLVFDGAGRVLGGNTAGRRQFCDLLGWVEAERICFAEPANACALDDARRRLVQAGLGEVIVKFELAASGAAHFAILLGGRLEDETGARGGGEAFALVFPDAAPLEALAACLMRSFSLTPAETRLALHLKDGLTLAEASSVLDVSVNTARNQLRAIFDKVGLRRQSELVRALAQLAALGATGALGGAVAGTRC